MKLTSTAAIWISVCKICASLFAYITFGSFDVSLTLCTDPNIVTFVTSTAGRGTATWCTSNIIYRERKCI